MMREAIFTLCILAVTVYLAVTALEDYKTCEVTRWKHLIGGIPAVLMYLINMSKYSPEKNILVIGFSLVYVAIGFVGVYGFADGLVLANLSMFFGGIGGAVGSGVVLLIVVIAAFSFLICHVIRSMVAKQKVFQKMAGALVPHIMVGYIVVVLITVHNLL